TARSVTAPKSPPSSSRQKAKDGAGRPAQCLTRRKRSSSTPATKRPSSTAAAEASAWKAEMPRIRLMGASSSFLRLGPQQLGKADVHHQAEPEGLQEVEDEPVRPVEDAEEEEVAVDEVEERAQVQGQ